MIKVLWYIRVYEINIVPHNLYFGIQQING